MQARVELEPGHALLPAAISPGAIQYALLPEAELETPFLPRDHPAWMRDAVAVSTRARQWIANLKPIAVRVLTFWDHTVRSIAIAGRSLSVDASGSYRVD
ncbi:MAG: hypothetical protein M3N19_08740 [Candidatus Eremiobacteraeota bacterium]|nr:hypothetical protein [Candidatus Eremiobacteraeota bacterium]